MRKIPISLDPYSIPSEFHELIQNASVCDSSGASEAKVYYIKRNNGYYLKTAAVGTLEQEANMTEYFHRQGLGSSVLQYISRQQDWLLTEALPGESGIYPTYLQDPIRLCDTVAQQLRLLHDLSPIDCPIQNRTQQWLDQAQHNYFCQNYDTSLFPDNWGFATAEEAMQTLQTYGNALTSDTLIHGDYCLPNIILEQWKFRGFVDLGKAGMGDRHMDLFWGIWSLEFNLKTDRYRQRFMDAYGKDAIVPELLSVIGALEVFL